MLLYLFRSAWRNRLRTLLTVMGVGVAVFLVTGLAAILQSRQAAVEQASQTLLVVSEKGEW
jgi:cell division protein FtsX